MSQLHLLFLQTLTSQTVQPWMFALLGAVRYQDCPAAFVSRKAYLRSPRWVCHFHTGFISLGYRPHCGFWALGSGSRHLCCGELRNAAQRESLPARRVRPAATLGLGSQASGLRATARLGSQWGGNVEGQRLSPQNKSLMILRSSSSFLLEAVL